MKAISFLIVVSLIDIDLVDALVAVPTKSTQNNILHRAFSSSTPSSSTMIRHMASTPTEETKVNGAETTTTATVEAPKDGKEEPIYFNILTEQDGPLSSSSSLSNTNNNDSTLSEVAQMATSNIVNSYQSINGWIPKDDYALWGLPGAIAPLGFFDPLGFARQGLPLNDAKRLREAETQHGRVAMLAIVGYFVQENIMNTVGQGGPFHITGPANDQLQQIPLPAFVLLTVAIAAAELYRAKLGWVEPQPRIGSKTLFTLRDSYYPGDIGFDPLNLKPTENYEFQKMQTKELSHGRLAMIGWAGIASQELVNHRTIAETWDIYSHLFTGDYDYLYTHGYY